MKNLPNIITFLRIILSPILLILRPLSATFLLVYFICGVSDIIDGYLARKFNITSKLGSILDSIADIVLVGIMSYVFLSFLSMPTVMLIFIAFIVVIRLASLVVVYVKYKTFAILHTYANRITGLMLFSSPFLYNYINTNILGYSLCILGVLSALEELYIHATSTVLKREHKGLYI